VQVGVLDEDYVLFIHSVGYSGAPDAFADVGLRRPLNATASGKIFLAAMPTEEVDRIMAKSARQFTSSTITSAVRMREEIALVKKMRYARNVEELLPGYWVLAAAVVGQDDRLAAAISITLPLSEFTPEGETSISAMLKDAARKASLQLGHSGNSLGILSWP
jgi:DNA-binding IclR family transcriptional regulator